MRYFVLGLCFAAALTACKKDPAPTSAPKVATDPTATALSSFARIGDTREGSVLVLAKLEGKRVAVLADEDARAIRVIDLDAKKELASTAAGGRPSALVIGEDGKLLAALRDEGKLVRLRPRADGTLAKEGDASTCEEPLALALAPDESAVLAACGAGHTVESYALSKLERSWSKSVGREPRALAVTPDGKRAIVSHAAESFVEILDVATGSFESADLGVAQVHPPPPRPHFGKRFPIDLEFAIPKQALDPNITENEMFIDEDIPFSGAPARFARQAFAMIIVTDPKGGEPRVIMPLAEVAPGDARIVSSGYGGGGIESEIEDFPSEVFDITILDPISKKRTSPPAVTLVRGKRADANACRLPRGVSKSGDTLLVACLGSSSLVAYDATKPSPAVHPKWRVALPAGPVAVAVDEERKEAVVFSQFDPTITRVSLTEETSGDQIKLTRSIAMPELAQRGRKLFHSGGDARISKDGRACASCHPDGRDDGLTWSTPNGPRQTIFLAGRVARKAPYGWMAEHTSLQEHMKTTIKNLKGTGIEAPEHDALAAYLQWMKGPSRSFRPLSLEEARGKEIFESGDSSCASCHDPKNDFSDHAAHDVKSAVTADTKKEFLAPSLLHIGASAPYFHDGRFANLDELVQKSDGTMGYTKHLSEADKKALVAYLKTL